MVVLLKRLKMNLSELEQIKLTRKLRTFKKGVLAESQIFEYHPIILEFDGILTICVDNYRMNIPIDVFKRRLVKRRIRNVFK